MLKILWNNVAQWLFPRCENVGQLENCRGTFFVSAEGVARHLHSVWTVLVILPVDLGITAVHTDILAYLFSRSAVLFTRGFWFSYRARSCVIFELWRAFTPCPLKFFLVLSFVPWVQFNLAEFNRSKTPGTVTGDWNALSTCNVHTSRNVNNIPLQIKFLIVLQWIWFINRFNYTRSVVSYLLLFVYLKRNNIFHPFQCPICLVWSMGRGTLWNFVMIIRNYFCNSLLADPDQSSCILWIIFIFHNTPQNWPNWGEKSKLWQMLCLRKRVFGISVGYSADFHTFLLDFTFDLKADCSSNWTS